MTIRTPRAIAAAIAALCLAPGAVRAADDAFGDFISPISNPVNFEDPRSRSDVRLIYAHHSIDPGFASAVGLGGGTADVVALQLRVALTDRFSLIATKDGYVWVRPDHQIPSVIEHNDGFANIALGAKYAFWKDEDTRTMATAGLRYEIPSGDAQALQGKVFINDALGDRGYGILNPFLSGLWGVGDLHLIGYTGFRLPPSDVDSSFFDVSLHTDYRLPFGPASWGLGSAYPTLELNWVQCIQGGDRVALDQEGFDFFDLGASQAGGTGVVTAAAGMRWRVADDLDMFGRRGGVDLGATWETPVTERKDIFGWRVTSDVTVWID